MKSFGNYIKKNLKSFIGFILVLFILNLTVFFATFYGAITQDYNSNSPVHLLSQVAASCSKDGITDDIVQQLTDNSVWGMFLDCNGTCTWSVNLPDEIPTSYSVSDVAAFTKGYLKDYPVFVWNHDDGLLVLGYPKGSYTKLTSNYYATDTIRKIPVFFLIILVLDLILLFTAYYISKRKILRNTDPIISSIESLSNGQPVSLSLTGDLKEVAESINQTSMIMNRQNTARANWISGVSHDIRTPLSMIMGYAERIANNQLLNGNSDPNAESSLTEIRSEAAIISKQSKKIKELVQDLNLVSQLEYEMQPINLQQVPLAKMLRTYLADQLNSGVPAQYVLSLDLPADAEQLTLSCDQRLLVRAINNLVQNSIRHNPNGCEITILLQKEEPSVYPNQIRIVVQDNGVGISDQELAELMHHSHYMDSTDDRLNLRHGLGLILVRQIVTAHHGTLTIDNRGGTGFRASMHFQRDNI